MIKSGKYEIPKGKRDKSITLSEDNQQTYKVLIRKVNSKCIAIKVEDFPQDNEFFSNNKHENSRGDYIIIDANDTNKILVSIIELKSGDPNNSEVKLQLKGARCFANYILEVANFFYDCSLSGKKIEYRFACITNAVSAEKRGISPVVRHIDNTKADFFLRVKGAKPEYDNIINGIIVC